MENQIIRYLKAAYQQSRLVLFVGAGISKNSNLPTWNEFIRRMGKEIGVTSNALTRNDFLKIPELFWETDPKRYLSFVKRNFPKEVKTNPLDDLIVSLQPDHIITTNYDTLLEQSLRRVGLSRKYLLVHDDRSFMRKCEHGNHYLIKMHGDVYHLNNLVLRESDYLNYKYTHIAISAFMKSLLMTHVFLFIGYSLRDINLNLIINWINNIKRRLGLIHKNEIKNVLLYSPSPQDIYSYRQEQVYYSHKNIALINVNRLPLPDDSPLKSPVGNRVYNFLKQFEGVK